MEENNVKEPDSVLNKDGKEFKTITKEIQSK